MTAAVRDFNPAQPRDPDGQWSDGAPDAIFTASMNIGGKVVKLAALEDNAVSLSDADGNTLTFSGSRELKRFRRFVFGAADLENVGDTDFLTRVETRDGRPFSVVTAGIKKTHIAPGSDDEDTWESDKVTLHIAPPDGFDDPDDLFATDGAEMTVGKLTDIEENLETIQATSERVDTGNGRVDMFVDGRDYVLTPAQAGTQELRFDRKSFKAIDKAINDINDDFDPDEGEPIAADTTNTRTVATNLGGVDVIQAGKGGTLTIAPHAFDLQFDVDGDHQSDFTTQIDSMLGAGPFVAKIRTVPAPHVVQPTRKVSPVRTSPVANRDGAVAVQDTDVLAELHIVRYVVQPVVWRAAGDDETDSLGLMDVRFSPFNTWYEVDSWWEGHFLERTVKGAFARTIGQHNDPNSSHQMKTLFNHGMDFHVGDKLLGDITDSREEKDSPVNTVNLWDTSYNRDLLPGLKRGSYGSSFMFRVTKEEWNREPEASDHNPDGLPERTIKETSTFEAGPVTWPASPTASAGMRCTSGTDAYYDSLARRDPSKVERMRQNVIALRSTDRLAGDGARPAEGLAPVPPNDSAPCRSRGLSPAERSRRLRMSARS